MLAFIPKFNGNGFPLGVYANKGNLSLCHFPDRAVPSIHLDINLYCYRGAPNFYNFSIKTHDFTKPNWLLEDHFFKSDRDKPLSGSFGNSHGAGLIDITQNDATKYSAQAICISRQQHNADGRIFGHLNFSRRKPMSPRKDTTPGYTWNV